MDHFTFPTNFNDFEQRGAGGYKVIEMDITVSDARLIEMLRNIDKSVSNNFVGITKGEHFSTIYHLIKAFGSNIEGKSMKLLEELAQSVECACNFVLRVALADHSHLESLGELRVAFKMAIFLSLYLLSATTIKKPKTVQGDILEQALREKGKRRLKSEQFEVSAKVFEAQKKIVLLLRQSLTVNFASLWEKKEVDGEFFKKYLDVCVRLLESNIIKDDQVIETIFQILETILSTGAAFCSNFFSTLANLAYEGDITDNLVQFFSRASGAELQKICTQALVLLVSFLTSKPNANSECLSNKNSQQFLSKLSEKIPKVFHTNLSCFIVLFKHQSYHLRNAIADILMNIIRYVLVGDAEDIYKEAREKYIGTLIQRIYDKTSYCRSHILEVLEQLTLEKVIPKKHLILFLKAGIERLRDQSMKTRKKALQLISAVVDELCTKEMLSIDYIDNELKMAELELATLKEDEERLKKEIEQIDDEDKLQELFDEVKITMKRIKAMSERELMLIEQKQISSLSDVVLERMRLFVGSKTESDVLESIKLTLKLHKLNFSKAKEVLESINLLIFSKDKKIRDEVLSTFIHLHLNDRSEEVARKLINLFTNASIQNQSAMEEILETLIDESLSKNISIIKPQCFLQLWNQFLSYERSGTNIAEKRAIITILRVVFTKDFSLIREQYLESFLNILRTYIEAKQPDFHVLKEISKVACLDDPKVAKNSRDFLLVQVYILVNSHGTSDNYWYSSCEIVLTCIFKICDSPEKLSELFIHKLHDKLMRDKSPQALSQFIFTLSHSCLKCMIYLDRIEGKLRTTKVAGRTSEEEELDRVTGGVEAEMDRKVEEVQMIAEKILEDPFIKKWVDIVNKVVLNFKEGNELEIICVLAYCKFMCLSASFCECRLQHILKILNNPGTHSSVKNNIIIAFGDLFHRFPNIVEPHSKHLYQNLHDKNVMVRKTTLTVITHLCLNDMIKIKSDLCDIALLFEDPDAGIANLVKQFFSEMNKKDPKTIFGIIPEALFRFSNSEREVTDTTFKVFLANIIPLLEKEKHSQSLVLKLCERLSCSLSMLEIKNTAFCLSQIGWNQKCVRRIVENFEYFKKTLESHEIAVCFKSLVTKLKAKRTPNTEFKNLIDELDQKVNTATEEVFNVEEIKRRNLEREQKKPKKKRSKDSQTKPKKLRKVREVDEESEDSSSVEEKIQAPIRQRSQRNVRKQMRVIVESDEAEQDDEDYSQ